MYDFYDSDLCGVYISQGLSEMYVLCEIQDDWVIMVEPGSGTPKARLVGAHSPCARVFCDL